MPGLLTGCGGMLWCLICSHDCVHSSCCTVLGTLPWPWMDVGHLPDTALARGAIIVHREGVPAVVWYVR